MSTINKLLLISSYFEFVLIALKAIILGQMLAKEQVERLSKLIDNSYGSPENLAKHLDMGIEMLFYIEDETFEKREIQNVVSAIKGIINILRNQE